MPLNDAPTIPARHGGVVNQTRRRLLLWFPAAVMAATTATLAAAAFRFLRPPAATNVDDAASNWTPVATAASLTGTQPLLRKVSIEHSAGWSVTRREHVIYVLPGQDNRVVSAVCPHEGCEVDWDAESSEFLCPCHDSRFNSGGGRLNGPAAHDLMPLPSRISGGVLEVQYRPSLPEAGPEQTLEHG